MTIPNEAVQYHETSFDLGDLLGFIWQKIIRIALLTLSIIVIAGFFVMQLPKIYLASSTLLLSDSSGSGMQMPSMALLAKGSTNNKMDTYIEFIRSRQFISQIIIDLDLLKEPEFYQKKPKNSEPVSYAIDYFLSNLSISKVRNTDMIRLSFSAYKAKLAMKIVNRIGPAFFDFHAKLQQQKVRDRSSRLNSQLDDISKRLSDAEQKLQIYQDKNNIVDVHIQIEMSKNEMASLVREKLMNDKLISEEIASIKQVKQNSQNEEMLLQIPWIMKNTLVQNLQNQIVLQGKVLAELSKRYKSKHHRFIAASSTLDSLKQELSATIKQLTAGLKQSVKRHLARKKELVSQIKTAKTNLNQLSRQEYQLTKFSSEVEAMQKVSELFTANLRETEILQDIGQSKEFAVVDFATEPERAAKPNVVLIMFMVSVVAIIFSIAFWLILHFKSDKEATYRQMLRSMGVPALISLPKVKKTFRSRSTLPLRSAKGETSYQFSEAIRSLRTSILIGQHQQENKIVAITSANPGEGKASLVINLAEACSNMEKTLLVDIDLTRPSIARAFQLADNHPGVADYLEQKVKFSECLHYENMKRLTVLPSGSIPNDPLAMMSTQRFVDFLQKLASRFDRLILEAPPIKTISDALVMSQLVDVVIIVCDTEKTELVTLTKMIQRLKEADIPLLGVVFNRSKT
jgi:polysaccharide biosynthesis transport protein